MAHVFRALWTDAALDIESSLVDCFGAWLRGRNTPIPIVRNGVGGGTERHVTTVESATTSMRGLQISLVENLGEQRGNWVTTVTGWPSSRVRHWGW